MGIAVEGETLRVSQQKNIEKLVKVLDLEESKPIYTPMANTCYEACASKNIEDEKLYRSIVGQSLYINLGTKPGTQWQ